MGGAMQLYATRNMFCDQVTLWTRKPKEKDGFFGSHEDNDHLFFFASILYENFLKLGVVINQGECLDILEEAAHLLTEELINPIRPDWFASVGRTNEELHIYLSKKTKIANIFQKTG